MEATGTIVPSPAKGQLFEMQATAIKVVGWSMIRYVSDNTETAIPWSFSAKSRTCGRAPRHRRRHARARHTIALAIHRFMHDLATLINTPIITASDAGRGRVVSVPR